MRLHESRLPGEISSRRPGSWEARVPLSGRLTTLLDIVVIFLFTKPLITILARTKFFGSGHPWSGLDPKRLGARPPIRGGRRRPRPSVAKEA